MISGVSAIHGDLPQTTRDRVMKGFRSGQISVLVATDVVGRGIDVEGISHVINYDMPDDAGELRPPDRPDRTHGQGRRRLLVRLSRSG